MTANDAGTPIPERPRDGAARSVGRPERAAEFMPRTRPVVPPIHHSVTYFLDDRAYKDVQDGGLVEHWYSRFRNPTVDAAAREIADLEGGAAGLMTLRMGRQTETAHALANALGRRPDVLAVRHPASPGYPRADVAARVMRPNCGGGAMVSITVEGGDQRAHDVLRNLRIGCEATSLGGVETLVSTPFNSSHFSLTPEERRAARIDDGMIRISCGLEPADALIADFARALDITAGEP